MVRRISLPCLISILSCEAPKERLDFGPLLVANKNRTRRLAFSSTSRLYCQFLFLYTQLIGDEVIRTIINRTNFQQSSGHISWLLGTAYILQCQILRPVLCHLGIVHSASDDTSRYLQREVNWIESLTPISGAVWICWRGKEDSNRSNSNNRPAPRRLVLKNTSHNLAYRH